MSSGGMMSSPFTLFREQDVRDRSSDDLVQALGNMLLDATYSYELLKRDVERIARDVSDISFDPPPPFDPSILAPVASSGLHSDLTLDDGTNPHGTTASDLGLATVATTGSYSDLSGVPSLATVATTGSYSDLSNVPATFAPTQHALFGSSHSGFTITELAEGDGLSYDGDTWVNLPVLRRIDHMWTIAEEVEALEMLSGSDIIFRNRSGTTLSEASEASAVGWAYSATRYIGLGYYDGNLALVDGTYTGGPSGDNPITYKPNATNTSRELEFKVKTTWKGASADLVIDGTLLNAAGKAMAIREIDVCVDGEAQKMLVLASEPY